jgi:hypothetical protein
LQLPRHRERFCRRRRFNREAAFPPNRSGSPATQRPDKSFGVGMTRVCNKNYRFFPWNHFPSYVFKQSITGLEPSRGLADKLLRVNPRIGGECHFLKSAAASVLQRCPNPILSNAMRRQPFRTEQMNAAMHPER